MAVFTVLKGCVWNRISRPISQISFYFIQIYSDVSLLWDTHDIIIAVQYNYSCISSLLWQKNVQLNHMQDIIKYLT